jgi:YbbR domain-containing protein
VVARKKTKEIPVTVTYEGDVPADYIKDTSALELDHTYVEISGPEDVVDQIHHAAITVDCTGRTESIYESLRYELQDLQGEPVDAAWITTNVSEVKVYLPVVMVKKIPLTVTLVDGGGATAKDVSCEINPKSITVSGSEEDILHLEELTLGSIDLAQVMDTVTKEYPIYLPAELDNVSGITSARVTVSVTGLSTRAFDVKNIELHNVPKGYSASLTTQVRTIVLRGAKKELDKVNASQIKIVADLSDLSTATGSYNVPVKVYVYTDGDVGVIGQNNVVVNLTKK